MLFQGQLTDAGTGTPLEGVVVRTDLDETTTDAQGYFELELAMDVRQVTFEFDAEGFEIQYQTWEVKDLDVQDLGQISMNPTSNANVLLSKEEQAPLVVISAEALEDEQSADISGLLTASRDIFVSTAAYTFGSVRFRVRGLNSEDNLFMINGVPYNELENGRVNFGAIGGLNDVLRNRDIQFGLGQLDYAIGDVGGGISLDTRASRQRKQARVSYAISNRSYQHRLMATYSTGLLKNGWAFSFSGSRRWAQEGYIEGSFYDSWAYFGSIDKKVGENHLFNLTVMGTPTRRGSFTAAIQELYDLTGSNYYNSYWGYQNGEKRNSRVRHTHQPLALLSHEWKMGENGLLTRAVSYQAGSNGGTALDWYNARDPRPNYYRYLPSAIEDPAQAALVAEAWKTDESVSQIDWDYLYNVNYNSVETIEDADGIEGNNVTGLRSKYILEDRRYDSKKLHFNTYYQHFLNEKISLQGGLGYQIYEGDNYKVVEDLLGGEFYLDINRFAERDFPGDNDAAQNDLNTPNRLLQVGDRFGYDYNPNIRKGYGWAQSSFSYRKVDFFLGGELSQTQFWRTGDVRTGLYPESSFGDSEKQNFLNYKVKGGVTYKINPKNYLYLNGLTQTKPPVFRNAYISPRTRDQVSDNLVSEGLLSGEVGYLIRGANLKARATAYWMQFSNQALIRSFYLDNSSLNGGIDDNFINYVVSGIDKQHRGVELAVDVKVVAGLSLNTVAALGQYFFTSRPTVDIYQDNNAESLLSDLLIYQKNFRVPGTPQNAYTFGIK
ncbi:MAG: TonB-dependent receptor, partial [Phaeodactylibacter sp.]|nr:TonB-dependent receptor [Phaeodactylibacter sp.]